MKFSEHEFFILEFSTRSSIFDTVESPNSLVVFTLMTPVILMQPLITSSPVLTFRGRLSPVKALVLSDVSPLVTMPSIGIFSPGFTDYFGTHRHFVGIDLFEFSVNLDICIVGSYIH